MSKETREILEQYYIDALPSTGSTRAHLVVITKAEARVDHLIAEKVAEGQLSQINKDRAVVLAYFTTGEQLKAFREMAEGIRATLTPPAEQAEEEKTK